MIKHDREGVYIFGAFQTCVYNLSKNRVADVLRYSFEYVTTVVFILLEDSVSAASSYMVSGMPLGISAFVCDSGFLPIRYSTVIFLSNLCVK